MVPCGNSFKNYPHFSKSLGRVFHLCWVPALFFGGGGLGLPGTHPQERTFPQRYTPPVLTSRGGHQSGWYASYWNAFLISGFEVPKLSILGPILYFHNFFFLALLHSAYYFFNILLFFIIQIQKLSSLALLGISFLNLCKLKVEVFAFGVEIDVKNDRK